MDQILLEKIHCIFKENKFSCKIILVYEDKKIFFSLNDILSCCNYDITSKNVFNQITCVLKTKDKTTSKEIYSTYKNAVSLDKKNIENEIYIDDITLMSFLITFKKGLEFKKCVYSELFYIFKNFYLS